MTFAEGTMVLEAGRRSKRFFAGSETLSALNTTRCRPRDERLYRCFKPVLRDRLTVGTLPSKCVTEQLNYLIPIASRFLCSLQEMRPRPSCQFLPILASACSSCMLRE